MNPKITPEHLARGAVVYVRQSSMGQVLEHTESQRRQYALAETARAMGFTHVQLIDEDMGRSGSGLVERPGFQRLVAEVCSGTIGAVFSIEASRLARNGRDWHHLIDLCALVGALVIDADGVYEPRMINDRLLLGLKGTMSEYELTLLRQRGLAARDSKAKRGALRFGLPPGYVWNELGQVEMDPDERVAEAVRLVFRKFTELGSARQVMLWMRSKAIELPVMQPGPRGLQVRWRLPAYHNILLLVRNPAYAGAYVFGRRETRTRVVGGRAVKTDGHLVPRERWMVLLRDHHPGYISWDEFERNQTVIAENAHMKQRTARKSGRGGRALLTGLLRCGRCGRMLHVVYGMRSGHAHRYVCVGDEMRTATRCIGVGGVRLDRAVAGQLVAVLEPQAIAAAIAAAERAHQLTTDVRSAIVREIEAADYEVRLAERRYDAVDPDKRQVARELEARWESALARVQELRVRLVTAETEAASQSPIDRAGLVALAQDLAAVWNAPTAEARTKQRLARILMHEVIVDVDDPARETAVAIHWVGGQHTELRVARIGVGRYTDEARRPTAVEALRRLGGHWPDQQLAVTLNRMRCRCPEGGTWTSGRVTALRDRLGIPAYDPQRLREAVVTLDEAARRLSICVASVYRLIREGVLPATQLMPAAPWQIAVTALESEAVQIGVRAIQERRPRNFAQYQDERSLRLPGF